MKNTTFVFDPHFPNVGISHHNSVREFLQNIESSKFTYLYNGPYPCLKQKKIIVSKFSKFKVAFYLFCESLVLIIKHRKKLKGSTIFLPHSDVVSTSLLLVARKIKLLDVSLTIRMIGIRDYSTFGEKNRMLISFFLNSFLQSDDRLAGETKALCRKLQDIQNRITKVEHAPYPGFIKLASSILPKQGNRMLFIGNPREDKGYLEVLTLVKEFPNLRLRIQLPDKDNFLFQGAVGQLRNHPNVEFFETPVSDEEILLEIAKAGAILMPYSKSRFLERGSGILTAGILMNKVIFGYRQTSFKEECEGFTEFCDWENIKDLTSAGYSGNVGSPEHYKEYVFNSWLRLLSC